MAFDTFWSIYPRKEKKPDARKAWDGAISKATIGTITAAAMRYRDDPNREPAYTQHPATWLRAECWNDPPLPPRRGGQSRPGPSRFSGSDNDLISRQESGPLDDF